MDVFNLRTTRLASTPSRRQQRNGADLASGFLEHQESCYYMSAGVQTIQTIWTNGMFRSYPRQRLILFRWCNSASRDTIIALSLSKLRNTTCVAWYRGHEKSAWTEIVANLEGFHRCNERSSDDGSGGNKSLGKGDHGLNSLANHGFLPRNGQNISRAVLSEALMSRYNLGADLTATLVSQVPDPFSLGFLSTHNFVEHDVSLVHADAYYERPPNEVNLILAADFLSRTNSEGRIGIPEVGKARKDRLATCLKNNPQCDFGTAQSKNAFAEGVALVAAMGGRQNDTISVAHTASFLVLEKFPSDYKKAVDPITFADLGTNSVKIAVYAV